MNTKSFLRPVQGLFGMIAPPKALVVSGALAWASGGCGESAKFGGSPAQAEAAASLTPYKSLTWFWQCESNPMETQGSSNGGNDPVLTGGGEHTVAKDRVRNTEVIFKGRLCPAENLKRDVVLVIDTSYSMSTNDPRLVDQCGRLNAAKALLASLPPDSRFGIVTFNSNLASYSTGLYSDVNQLYNDLSRNRTLADALCATEGGTNYDVAISQAGAILAKGRLNGTKEIYFVSDGQPDPGNDGILKAESLKESGVAIGDKRIPTTIATVMLKGVDTVLESEIASRDPVGKALHAFAADTSQLTDVLKSLSANEIVDAELKIRPIGTEEYTVHNILDSSTDLDFVVPSITISGDSSRQGFEVLYSYRDKRGYETSSGGRLIWQEVTAGSKSLGAKASFR